MNYIVRIVSADFYGRPTSKPQYYTIRKLSLTKFWHLMCMSCKVDIIRLGVCALRISAIMNLIPHDIDA